MYLKSLDPPMSIPRSRITRWHPEFMVDNVPDVVSAALPQPPNVERVATARDVLGNLLFIRIKMYVYNLLEKCLYFI